MRRLMFFAGGVLCGVVVGATVALLLTPESGDAMRAEARNRFDDAKREANLAAEKRRLELEAQLAQLTGTAPREKSVVKIA